MERRDVISDRLNSYIASADPLVRERLTEEQKKKLVDCLLDGTVYSIVESLRDLQRLKETELNQERDNVLRSTRGSPDAETKLADVDRKILSQLDATVKEQQSTLCCTGVPLFKITQDPCDLRIQYSIVKFIQSLHSVYA